MSGRVLPRGFLRQGRAVAHGDQVARAEEGVGFAIADALVDNLRGVDHHEQAIAVGFELRSLVRVAGVKLPRSSVLRMLEQAIRERFVRRSIFGA